VISIVHELKRGITANKHTGQCHSENNSGDGHRSINWLSVPLQCRDLTRLFGKGTGFSLISSYGGVLFSA
jgi:Tfp pilus assembly major pilin PilA